jgi:hypothetical protein
LRYLLRPAERVVVMSCPRIHGDTMPRCRCPSVSRTLPGGPSGMPHSAEGP